MRKPEELAHRSQGLTWVLQAESVRLKLADVG